VGKQERQRRLARERYERQMRRRTQRARKVRQWTVISGAGIAVIALAVVGYFIFAPARGTPAAAPTTTPSATASSPAAAAQPAAAVSRCSYISAPPAARSVGSPPTSPDTKSSYLATIHTNRGDIVIKMTGSQATCTVNSFVYLAGKKYFDNTKCHRLTTSGIYVLQCGDPTGKGTGGPGYRFANEVVGDSTTASSTYPAGVVAMAHLNQQSSSNGSQFFLVYKDTTLPRDYTPFGTITSGLNVLQSVANAGVAANSNGAGDGPPKESVIIESVSIKRT
jgi:peptidyl-prolyl cis-trans isomerase B (cyclophilin B)